MSISLSSVLQVAPSTWSSEAYSGRNCVTIELASYSTEYTEIETSLRSHGATFGAISKIERVQHPFAYGRFLLRKEQLEKRNGSCPSMPRKFFKVSTNEIKEALEYNMDTRRTSSISEMSSYSSVSGSNYCVIVTRRIGNRSRDSEEYPEYVIYFN